MCSAVLWALFGVELLRTVWESEERDMDAAESERDLDRERDRGGGEIVRERERERDSTPREAKCVEGRPDVAGEGDRYRMNWE